MDDAKGLWAKELSSTLWAIRTTMRSGTRDTPFNLTFKMDAVIPVKIRINTLRIRHFDPNQNEENTHTNLDLLKEVRDEVSIRSTTIYLILQ